MIKHRVAVIRGGPGVEYDISMQTGGAVLNAIRRDRFEPIDIVVSKNGEWLREGYVKFPEKILSDIDLVFIAMHGAYGEDGTLQRFLDTYKIPYVGSGALASATAINKPLTKDRLRDVGVLMPPHMIVTQESQSNLRTVVQNIAQMFGPEYVIKPLDSGSSLGVELADNVEMLAVVLQKVLRDYPEVLVEKRIRGKEASCGILEHFRGKKLYILPPIEVVQSEQRNGFFSANAECNVGARGVCPGRFSKEEKQTIEQLSALVHDTLGLSQYSCSDFMIENGDVYFLEVNTLPKLVAESLFPRAITAVGSDMEEFINLLLSYRFENAK